MFPRLSRAPLTVRFNTSNCGCRKRFFGTVDLQPGFLNAFGHGMWLLLPWTASVQSAPEQPFRALATLLDALVIAFVAVTVVLLLGAAPWVEIGGRSILLPQVWRLILFAAVVAVLRYAIDRDAPILATARRRRPVARAPA